MSFHVDRVTLLGYLDADDTVDRIAVGQHVTECGECQQTLRELERTFLLLGDGNIHRYVAEFVDARERAEQRESGLGAHERSERDFDAADNCLAELMRQPIERWIEALDLNPASRTMGLVRRLISEIEVELNRRPQHALMLVTIAEHVALSLGDRESVVALGDVWKQRSNALRHLARYEEALEAAAIAESFYSSSPTGDFDVAQAQYTRAAALFKMTRLREASDTLAAAVETLRDYGPTIPLGKTIMLRAAITFEEGDTEHAENLWREVIPLLEEFDDWVELARVRANLAECNLRLQAYDAAMNDALAAIAAYSLLRMDAEIIRSRWTIAKIRLASGDDGLDELRNAAAAFEALGMSGDAGFVKLDATAVLLTRGEWLEAEITAREIVTLFTAAGVTMASATALVYLREAVARREATAATVDYVREYVARDDPQSPFLPPPFSN